MGYVSRSVDTQNCLSGYLNELRHSSIYLAYTPAHEAVHITTLSGGADVQPIFSGYSHTSHSQQGCFLSTDDIQVVRITGCQRLSVSVLSQNFGIAL